MELECWEERKKKQRNKQWVWEMEMSGKREERRENLGRAIYKEKKKKVKEMEVEN